MKPNLSTDELDALHTQMTGMRMRLHSLEDSIGIIGHELLEQFDVRNEAERFGENLAREGLVIAAMEGLAYGLEESDFELAQLANKSIPYALLRMRDIPYGVTNTAAVEAALKAFINQMKSDLDRGLDLVIHDKLTMSRN